MKKFRGLWKVKGKQIVEAWSQTTSQDRSEKKQLKSGEEPENNDMGLMLQEFAEIRTDQSFIYVGKY